MNEKIIKVLFSGISEKIEEEIKIHLNNPECLSEFCDFENTKDLILNFHPEILITTIEYSLPEYKNRIIQLKIVAELSQIPFAVIINRSEKDPYLFLISNGITNLITSPINKNDFLNYLNRYLGFEKTPGSSTEIQCNDAESSLITNLVIQNRMFKDHLKKAKSQENQEIFKSSDHHKEIHSERINEHRAVENKLWEAYENGYFRLFYQPVISIESGKLAGFEALIRIIHPVDGLIPPDVFISIAESSAIIFPARSLDNRGGMPTDPEMEKYV